MAFGALPYLSNTNSRGGSTAESGPESRGLIQMCIRDRGRGVFFQVKLIVKEISDSRVREDRMGILAESFPAFQICLCRLGIPCGPEEIQVTDDIACRRHLVHGRDEISSALCNNNIALTDYGHVVLFSGDAQLPFPTAGKDVVSDGIFPAVMLVERLTAHIIADVVLRNDVRTTFIEIDPPPAIVILFHIVNEDVYKRQG